MGCDSRLLTDEDAVRVDELITRSLDLSERLGEQAERIGISVALVVGRKEQADVTKAGRTEQRIRQCVCDHVSVGMPCKPTRIAKSNSAEHERQTLLEGVRVDAETDSQLTHESERNAAGSSASESICTSASSDPRCSRPHGPRRT